MPPTVTASRGQSESSDDQSSDGECPSRLPEAGPLDDDDCCTTSCESKFSDESSKDQSTSSTPQHSEKSVPAERAEECLLSPGSLQEENDIQHTPSRFFKFKRKHKLLIYSFLKKLKVHLIMCLKFVLSLLLVLATVQFSFPDSVRHPFSHQFFPTHTLVTDFYEGELQLLAEKLQHTDLALVMYYAPWDRESQLARTQFAHAAKILHDQVFFCAMNCWQPQSFCRMNHKVNSYPALVLHVNTGALKGAILRESRAFAYSGPVLSEHMVRFVTAALRPYQHVPDRRHLASLQLTHSAVMLTYIHGGLEAEYTDPTDAAVLHAQHQLALWYRAALHWLDYDKRAEVTWAVITNPSLAAQLGLIINSTAEHSTRPKSGLPPVRLLIADINYEFNRTLPNWREPKPMLEWVMTQLADTVSWLEVTGAKSSVLNSLLRRGPSLLVFTPDRPQHSHNVLFDAVRGLWLQYSTCAPHNVSVQDTRAGRMASFLLDSHQRHAASVAIASAQCSQRASHVLSTSEAAVPDAAEDCSLPLSLDGVDTKAEMCEDGHFTCHPFMPFFAKPGSGVGELVWSLVGDACQSLFGFSNPVSQHVSPPCHMRHHRAPANTTSTAHRSLALNCANKSGGIEDERVQELLLWHEEEVCRRLQTSDVLSLSPAAAAPSRALLDSLAGGVCRSNRTLQFGLLDARLHADLASHWGLNWTQHSHASGAVLVDLAREAHYVLQEPVSAASLAAFLVNFSRGLLDRVELSGVPLSRYSSDYTEDSEESVQQSVLASLRRYSSVARHSREDQLETDPDVVSSDVRQQNTDTDQAQFQSYVTSQEELIEIHERNDEQLSDTDEFIQLENIWQNVQKQTKLLKNHGSTNIDEKGEANNQADVQSEEVSGSSPATRHEHEAGQRGWEFSITELSADTYYNFTNTPGQAVVVLHYSRSCVFCTAVSHALLTTASYLAQLAPQQKENGGWNGVAFGRIDMSANTLPWHLNFPHLPALVYYPPYRKSHTKVLDARTPLTADNIMRFVAAQLSPRLRTRLAMAGCSSDCSAAISARLPALNSQVKNELRLVLARLRRVTDAALKLQSDELASDDIAPAEGDEQLRHSASDAPRTSTSSAQAVGSKSDSVESDVKAKNLFDSSNTSTPLTSLEILQLRRSSLAEELTALRSQAQFLNLLQEIVVQQSTHKSDQADGFSLPFDVFLQIL